MTDLPPIAQRLHQIERQIREAERQHHRDPGSVQLVAVSKTRPASDLLAAHAAGQHRFGESYLQEALEKIEQLAEYPLEWHFIGRIQGNKTRPIAEHFAWVHSLDSLRHAQRLNDQRPSHLPPLKLCVQVNIDQQSSKGGVASGEIAALVSALHQLPRLRLEGLMTLPAAREAFSAQRQPFAALRQLRDRLATPAQPLTTLSMGMSDDLEAAIAEGATLVRVGSALFGERG